VLCDEVIIHHVEENSIKRIEQHTFDCWVLTKDPSRIPQVVFLSLVRYESDPRRSAQIHFVRPRGVKTHHVFRVLIHIDAVEDLLFYHYPREELITDGKIP
jgi:hypothetical protein